MKNFLYYRNWSRLLPTDSDHVKYVEQKRNVLFSQFCIIATFSIRQRWAKNVELAMRFASGERDLPVMSAINRIADNVVSFDDPYSALNGDKTNAFAHNIANDVMAVTLDVWMIRAVGGDTKKSLGKKAYRDLANDLREAAMIYGMVPSHFQALIWILVRGSSQ